MMKRIFLLVAYLFTSFSAFCQEPVFEWAVQMGGALSDSGHSIATDTFGNVYTTGSFSNNAVLSDTADFDSGPGFYGLFSNGDADIFVSKLSPDGDLLWAVSFGSDEGDRGFGIATDASGNVYVTGIFQGWVDFDPGPEIHILSSALNFSDIFVLKLDTNGSLVWAKQMGGSTHDFGESIAVDNEGNVYTTGAFTTTADFDPGPDVFNLTYNSNAQYQPDIFISKLNSDGEFVWAKSIGGGNNEQGNHIVLDNFDNVYVTGSFADSVDFDPGMDEFVLQSIGFSDLFLLKLNSSGSFLWVKNIGGSLSRIGGSSIAVDVIGNIYTTGDFDGVVDFDPGVDANNLESTGYDIFILKLNSEGDYIWAKSLGGGMSDGGRAIVVDENNNIYTTGIFQNTVDFDPGLGVYNLSAIGGDAFVLKLNVEGSFIWAASLTGNDESDPFSFNIGESITLDKWDNIYTAGSFIDTTDFDPDTTNFNLVSYGTLDVFIQKMKQPCHARTAINTPYNNFAICEEESITLNTTALPPFVGNASYFWNTGDTTNFIVVTPDSNSIYTLSVSYIDDNIECFFTDTVEVSLLENSDTIYLNFSSCDSLVAGIVELIYPSQNGCDSIVIETTTFIPVPDTPVVPNDLVIQEETPPFQIMIPEVANAIEYVWTVPVGVEILSGVNTNSIIVDWDDQVINGSVCVSAINDCGSSPTACLEVTVEITDLAKEVQTNRYRIFPNPADAVLNVVFEGDEFYKLVLLDFLGREVREIDAASSSTVLSIKDLPSGTYWVKIINRSRGYEEDWKLEKIEIQR